MDIVRPILKEAPRSTGRAKRRSPFGGKVSIKDWNIPADTIEEELTGKCQINTAELTSHPSALSSRDG